MKLDGPSQDQGNNGDILSAIVHLVLGCQPFYSALFYLNILKFQMNVYFNY